MKRILVATRLDVLAVKMHDGSSRFLKADPKVQETLEQGEKRQQRCLTYTLAESLDGKDVIICLRDVKEVRLDKDALLFEKGMTDEPAFADDDLTPNPGYYWDGNKLMKNQK